MGQDKETAQVVMKRADGRSLYDIEGPVTAASPDRTAAFLDEARVADIRARLEARGFAIEGGDRATLSVSGPAELFVETFGLDPAGAREGGAAAHATRIPDALAPFVADVFVEPGPTFFP